MQHNCATANQNPTITDGDLEKTPTSQSGDIWILGKHKLICGDACKKETYQTLLGDEVAEMLLTDPPYNVRYGTRLPAVYKNSLIMKHKILNDNLGKDFKQFLSDFCNNALTFTRGGCYISMSCAEIHTLQQAFIDAGGKCSTLLIWVKNTFILGRSDYQRQYEAFLYGWKKNGKRYWCGARNQSDVWHYKRPRKNDLHPTMKPLELCKKAILNSSQIDGIVLDCFGGSGTTLIACEELNRSCRMIELEPKYVDVTIKRWQSFSSKEAILLRTGESFNEIIRKYDEQSQLTN